MAAGIRIRGAGCEGGGRREGVGGRGVGGTCTADMSTSCAASLQMKTFFLANCPKPTRVLGEGADLLHVRFHVAFGEKKRGGRCRDGEDVRVE
jgi:hypothetical protein